MGVPSLPTTTANLRITQEDQLSMRHFGDMSRYQPRPSHAILSVCFAQCALHSVLCTQLYCTKDGWKKFTKPIVCAGKFVKLGLPVIRCSYAAPLKGLKHTMGQTHREQREIYKINNLRRMAGEQINSINLVMIPVRLVPAKRAQLKTLCATLGVTQQDLLSTLINSLLKRSEAITSKKPATEQLLSEIFPEFAEQSSAETDSEAA